MSKEETNNERTEISGDNWDSSTTNRARNDRSNYFIQLEAWMKEFYTWQGVIAMLPQYLAVNQIFNNPAGLPVSLNNSLTTLNNTGARIFPQISVNQQNDGTLRQRRPESQPETTRVPNVNGIEYRIPPIWKRFVAEFIDSTMLFLLKLSITFIAVDVFDFINIEPYDFDILQRNLRIDYRMAMELTSGIIILELIHRVIVCIFEALWIQRGLYGHIGGATPGKSVMGLRVVQCRNITPVERPDGEAILVSPGTDLGLPLALGRSIVKNLILALLFPICFALFFFRFNRTGYDLICHSIVVEDPYRNATNNNIRRANNQRQ